MRRGWNGDMVLTPKGSLMAIATGSDACSEHEWGSAELLQALTGAAGQTARDVAAQMKIGAIKRIPLMEERRRIRANLESILYEEGVEEGVPVAALGFPGVGRSMHKGLLGYHELFLSSRQKESFVGAWDSESFGFKVAGAKLVEKLRGFSAQVRSGKGIFAGTFLTGSNGMQPRGVCIAIEDLLRTEHRQAMAKAQVEFVGMVQLELRSRAQELKEISWKKEVPRRNVIGIWAIWKDGVVGGDVAYCVNPGHGCKGPGGPKSFEELRDWLNGAELTTKAGC